MINEVNKAIEEISEELRFKRSLDHHEYLIDGILLIGNVLNIRFNKEPIEKIKFVICFDISQDGKVEFKSYQAFLIDKDKISIRMEYTNIGKTALNIIKLLSVAAFKHKIRSMISEADSSLEIPLI